MKCGFNLTKHSVHILQNLIIPETQNAITTTYQPLRSLPVGSTLCCLCVLPSIDFNDEFCLMADEVDNVRAYRCLTPKPGLAESMRTQTLPKRLLSIRHGMAQAAC